MDQRSTISTASFRALLSRWIEKTRSERVPVGISASEALDRAAAILGGGDLVSAMPNEPDQLDVVHALAQLLTVQRPQGLASRCREAYLWLFDIESLDSDERHDLLAEFAYLCWSDQLRAGCYLEREEWAARCDRHAKAQETIAAFLALPAASRTRAITDRFLREGSVRVAYCLDLKQKLDRFPASAMEEAVKYYKWVWSQEETISFEERTFLAGRVALVAGGAARMLGRRAESAEWFARAADHLSQLVYAEPELAILAYNRLALAYDCGNYETVLRDLEALTHTFAKLSMDDYLSKSNLLLGMVLKNVGRVDEAEIAFGRISNVVGTSEADGLRGLALTNLGELAGAKGNHAEAMEHFVEAVPLIVRAPWCFSKSNFMSSLGEVFRRAGEIGKALACYRAAIQFCTSNGQTSVAAYLRVLLAETLLDEGSIPEAQEQILLALPTISTERMVREGIAAVTLLKKSLQGRELSPTVMRAIRECIEAQSQGEQVS